MLNRSAYQKPSTRNPVTSASHIKIIMALMARRKRPKVKMVTGKVKIIKIGFTNILRTISTAATTMAVRKFVTLIPGSIFDNTTTAIALRIISISVFLALFSFMLMSGIKH